MAKFIIIKQITKENGHECVSVCVCDRICIESRMFVWIYNEWFCQNCFLLFLSEHHSKIYVQLHRETRTQYCPVSRVDTVHSLRIRYVGFFCPFPAHMSNAKLRYAFRTMFSSDITKYRALLHSWHFHF